MAAIDKTYVDGKQLQEAIEWVKSIGGWALFETGLKLNLMSYICGYNPDEVSGQRPIISSDQYILWNTPTHLDRWLLQNCPLKFIVNRIKDVYSEKSVQEMLDYRYIPWEPTNPVGHHCTFLDYPRCHDWKGVVKHWWLSVKSDTGERYGLTGRETWEPMSEYQLYHGRWNNLRLTREPDRRWLSRFARHSKLPVDAIIEVTQIRYIGLDWRIRIRK